MLTRTITLHSEKRARNDKKLQRTLADLRAQGWTLTLKYRKGGR